MNHCAVQEFSVTGSGPAHQSLDLKVLISYSSPKSGKISSCYQHKSVQITTSPLRVLIKSVGVYPSHISVTKTNTILKFISENM